MAAQTGTGDAVILLYSSLEFPYPWAKVKFLKVEKAVKVKCSIYS